MKKRGGFALVEGLVALVLLAVLVVGVYTVYVVPRGLKMYLLWSELYVGGRDENGALQLHEGSRFAELDQILSTFQFTD